MVSRNSIIAFNLGPVGSYLWGAPDRLPPIYLGVHSCTEGGYLFCCLRGTFVVSWTHTRSLDAVASKLFTPPPVCVGAQNCNECGYCLLLEVDFCCSVVPYTLVCDVFCGHVGVQAPLRGEVLVKPAILFKLT